MSEENVPELRFPEFEGTWDCFELGDLGSFKNGHNADKEDYGKGSPLVNLNDVYGKPRLGNKITGLVLTTEKQRREYSVKEGDVLFARSSVKRTGVGDASVALHHYENYVFSGFIIRFRPRTGVIETQFQPAFFNRQVIKKEILSRATTSANTNINQVSLSRVPVNLPTLPEQKKIAAFLSAVDDKLAAVEAQLAGWRDYKRGMMQALFSQTLRFKADDGSDFPEWKRKRIKNFAKVNPST